MDHMSSFQNLIVWQKAFNVAESIYMLTDSFPTHQRFELSSQMQRSAVSIMSNIAEGSRRSKTGWLYFTQIALGSAAELEAQLLLARKLKFGSEKLYTKIFEDLEHILKILQSIQKNKN